MSEEGAPDMSAEIAWTERQRQVLELLAKGYTNPQIGEALGLTLDGAKWHVSEVLSKLGVHSREEAAAYWRAYNRPAARVRRSLAGISGGLALRVAGASTVAVVVLVVAIVIARGGPSEPVTGDPTPGPTAPPGEGPVVVYARVHSPTVVVNGRPYAERLEIVTFDVAGGRELHSFAIESVPWGSPSVLLRGDAIIVNLGDEIRRYPLDGAGEEVLVLAPTGHFIDTFDFSPEGDRIAYWLASEDIEVVEMELVLHDIANDEAIARFASEELEAVAGFVQQLRWDAEGESLVVRVGRPHGGILHRVHADGTIEDFGLGEEGLVVAPDLSTAFYPIAVFDGGICGPVEDKDGDVITFSRGIRDLRTNEDYWRMETEGVAGAAIPSPDGREYLVADLDCTEGDRKRVWSTVSVDNPEPVPVPDKMEVLEEWYGEALITAVCDGEMMPIVPDGLTGLGYHYGKPASKCDFAVGGAHVDSHTELLVLGFVEAAALN